MTLIKCNECGKEISDKSKTCIHCGCPIKNKKQTCNKKYFKYIFVGIAIIILILIIFSTIFKQDYIEQENASFVGVYEYSPTNYYKDMKVLELYSTNECFYRDEYVKYIDCTYNVMNDKVIIKYRLNESDNYSTQEFKKWTNNSLKSKLTQLIYEKEVD